MVDGIIEMEMVELAEYPKLRGDFFTTIPRRFSTKHEGGVSLKSKI